MIPSSARSPANEFQDVLTRIFALCAQIEQQLQADQSIDDTLEQLDTLLRCGGDLVQQVQAKASEEERQRLCQQGQEVLGALQKAWDRATLALQALSESLDRGIQGQRGNRAYRTVGS